ncbi:MAG: mechanosensitive ion channel domain-containing protein [Desulfatirhabdiaceae bacterium]
MKSILEYKFYLVFCFVFFSFLLGDGISPCYAENGDAPRAQPVDAVGYQQTVEMTILAEKENIDALKVRQKLAENEQRTMMTVLNAYRIQISAYSNILLLPQSPTQDLEKAWIENVNAMNAVDLKIREMAEKIDDIGKQLTHVTEQIQLNTQQFQDFVANPARDVQTDGIKKNIQNLISLLTARQNRLDKIQTIYSDQQAQLQDVYQMMVDLSKRFDDQIDIRKKQELFQRKVSPLKSLSIQKIQNDTKEFGVQILSLFSIQFWIDSCQNLWATGIYFQVLSVVILILFVFFLLRIRRYFSQMIKPWNLGQFPWRNLVYTIFRRSLVWMGLTALLYAYIQMRGIWMSSPLIRMVFHIMVLGLFTQWVMDALRAWNRLMASPLSESVIRLLKYLIVGISMAGSVLIVLDWMMTAENIIQIFFRMIMEMVMLAWMVFFIKTVKSETDAAFPQPTHKSRVTKWAVSFLGYGLVSIPLVMEITGYNHMALYWLISVGNTLVAVMWSVLVFFALREWERNLLMEKKATLIIPSRHSVQWLGIQSIRIFWFFAAIVIVLMCWGVKRAVIVNVFKVINYPVPIGDIRFSLMSLFYALLALVITVLVTRFWRQALKEKILKHSGLDPGLQDSIMTLTVYLIWAMGLFISLRVIGVSATSLTVVFGALSIGLGFGLQNIFNNFISGIILLFERPIQVGDAVEISGIWGIVKKINFRSTLVQTYDNASLIIPNSEFISNSVTNWSFKDQRLRRIITIGVAYGTDARVTADTLLEIAKSCPWVLADPKPDVLFSDFGDSALIFKLRIWTLLDSMIAAENDIRYRINQTFSEMGIEIPFPQQDIHIRSGMPTAAGAS